MFQTNRPEFDSAPEGPTRGQDASGKADRLDGANEEKRANRELEFASLEAFAAWVDVQLAELEDAHEGFETVSSVRGFYGR